MVTILMISTKTAILHLLKIKLFFKVYDVIVSVHYQQNFIMWIKLYCKCVHKTGNCSIYMR